MSDQQSRRYTESEKLSILRDYYSSGESKSFITKKYSLCGISLLNLWIKSYPIEENSVYLDNLHTDLTMTEKKTDDLSSIDSKETLEKRIKALEKALAYSQLETRALNVLIDIAEKEVGIRIRKKSGAKQ
jgi:transposase-like protein